MVRAMRRSDPAGDKAGSSTALMMVKTGMAVAGCAAGLLLLSAVRGADGGGDETSARDLQGLNECAESLWPVRDGKFQTKGIQFCVGSNASIALATLLMFYSFWALAVLVDEGFVTVLDYIVQELGISEDVAGATFMAAGGSAPEFFTNLISTFESTGTGFGTIVGSAVFNILFVISMSAFFSRPREEVVRRRDHKRRTGETIKEPWEFKPLPLTWWPLLRDSTVYVSGLIVLAAFYYCVTPLSSSCSTTGGAVMWFESLVLFMMYVAYCTLMAFQERIKTFVVRYLPFLVPTAQRAAETEAADAGTAKVEGSTAVAAAAPSLDATELGEGVDSALPDEDEQHHNLRESLKKRASVAWPEGIDPKRISFNAMGRRALVVVDEVEDPNEVVEPRMRPMSWKGDEAMADNKLYRVAIAVTYALVLPIVATRYTIYFNYDKLSAMQGVKARVAGVYAFFMSLAWIAFFTWTMVYAAESLGATMGIPDVILGFTILAAGTSTPDLLSSVFVAQLGYGDMAVSSSIGSNIFDILVGLPVPWLLKYFVSKEAISVPVGAIGVSLSVIIAMMVCLVAIVVWQDWKLTKMSAWAMLVLYFLFLVVVCLAEML